MTPVKRTITFRIDDEQFAAMQQLFGRDGITVSEQIRRALKMWLESKGVQKAAPRRAVTRRKP